MYGPSTQCYLVLCNHTFCRHTHQQALQLQCRLFTLLDVFPTLLLLSDLVCVYLEWNKDMRKPLQWAFWHPFSLCWATARCCLSHWWTQSLLAVAVASLLWGHIHKYAHTSAQRQKHLLIQEWYKNEEMMAFGKTVNANMLDVALYKVGNCFQLMHNF